MFGWLTLAAVRASRHEPFALLSIAGVRAQTFDGDRTVETIVVRGVDDTHASFTELAHDAIPAGCPRVTRRCRQLDEHIVDWGVPQRRSTTRSGAAGELARLGVDLHLLAFLDEERHANLEAGLERRGLGHAAARGVAAHARLGVATVSSTWGGNWMADRVAVVLVDLHHDVVDQQLAIVADDVGARASASRSCPGP